MFDDFIDQSPISEILNKEYQNAKSRNPSYSLRAFAKKLDINSGALSEIMQRKRLISYELAQRLADKLNLESHALELFFQPFVTKEKLERVTEYSLIDSDAFRADTFWIGLGILNSIQLKPNLVIACDFAREFGVSEDTIHSVLETLKNKGLIEICEDGSAKRIAKNVTTTDNITSEHIRRIHHSYLRLGDRSLQIHSTDSRDFTSMVLPMRSDRIELAKNLIRKFQDDFCALMETGDSNAVYMLNMQLFPLGKEPPSK